MKIEIIFLDESKLALDGYKLYKEVTDWIYLRKDNSEYQIAKSEIRAIIKTG